MKRFVFAFTLLLLSGTAIAQQGTLDEKWLSYMVETERRAIFQEGMILNDANKEAFWTIYDEYETALVDIRKKNLDYLKGYAAEYNTLTDEQAISLTKQGQDAQLQRILLQRKYAKKLSKEVGGKIAARFVQIDNAIYMLLRLQILDEIPMVGDLN